MAAILSRVRELTWNFLSEKVQGSFEVLYGVDNYPNELNCF